MLRFAVGDELLHEALNVADVESASVKRAVCRDGPEHLRDRAEPALACRIGLLDDHPGRTHAEDQAMASAIKRKRRLFEHFVGGCCAARKKPGADPLHKIVARRVVRGDDDHPTTAALCDPILGERDGLGAARTRRIDLGVGTASPDVLRQLRVSHRERFEDEPPVELIGITFELALKLGDVAVELDADGLAASIAEASSKGLKLAEEHTLRMVLEVGAELSRVHVEPRKRRAENHTGVIAHRLGQTPAFRQLRALRGGLVVHHQRNTGIAKRFDPRCHGHPRGRVHGVHSLLRNPEVGRQRDVPTPPGKLDDLGRRVDRLESGPALVGLDQSRDLLVRHRTSKPDRDRVDEGFAV